MAISPSNQTDIFSKEPVVVGGFVVGESSHSRLVSKYGNYIKVGSLPLVLVMAWH